MTAQRQMRSSREKAPLRMTDERHTPLNPPLNGGINRTMLPLSLFFPLSATNLLEFFLTFHQFFKSIDNFLLV